MADQRQSVLALARPIVDSAGAELVDVEVKAGRGRGLVRVIVDRKGGVPLELCQDISRDLSAALDATDPVEGRYALEVTSPGVDRPLRDRAAFDRVEGREVNVHHRDPGDADRVLVTEGRVLEAAEESVVIDTAEGPVRVPYSEVVTATQKLPW